MKKVRFSGKVEVYEIEVDSNHGGMSQADHHRFKKRIQRVNLVLNEVLQAKLEKIKIK